jgi:hypothetical protein
LVVLGALPLGTYQGKVQCRSDCAAKQAVFLLHGEDGRGAIAVPIVGEGGRHGGGHGRRHKLVLCKAIMESEPLVGQREVCLSCSAMRG